MGSSTSDGLQGALFRGAAAGTSREEAGKSCLERRLWSDTPSSVPPATSCQHTPGRQDPSRASLGDSGTEKWPGKGIKGQGRE